MKTSKLILFLLILCLLGATNTSHSQFVIEFKRDTVPINSLIIDAIAMLEQNGFHRTENKNLIELQYANNATWVIVNSSGADRLELSFTQLRGGCGNNPKVTGANEIVTKLHRELVGRYGIAEISEIHRANDME